MRGGVPKRLLAPNQPAVSADLYLGFPLGHRSALLFAGRVFGAVEVVVFGFGVVRGVAGAVGAS
jgi:hypothetical protein